MSKESENCLQEKTSQYTNEIRSASRKNIQRKVDPRRTWRGGNEKENSPREAGNEPSEESAVKSLTIGQEYLRKNRGKKRI